ncbi:MAG TPA: hypothetical protein VGM92_07350 [Candidatus Kapabacteria bacterium]|jgi:hypothetical protein
MEIALNRPELNRPDLSAEERVSAPDAVAGGPFVVSEAFPEHAPRARVITSRPKLPLSDLELRARVQWGHCASSHFQISYDRTAFNDKRAAMLNESLEIAYSLIFHFTHESFADRFQIYAVDQRSPGLLGCAVWPHFNTDERAIYLVENSTRSIHSELGGLLAHAMRIARYGKHYRSTPGWAVLEEGFSIFLSERLSTQPDIFPFFGAEPNLIASHLYGDRETRLPAIWNASHDALHLEERILAGAFFLYLGDTFGDDRVVSFSKSDDAISDETFQAFFRHSMRDLEAGWLQHFPVAFVALTETERETMVQHWERSIESCHR